MSYILAIYIILLAAVPCCSFDDCPDDKTEQAAHEKGDEDCGSCSPFFSCEGCATVSIAYHPFQFEITALQSSPVYTAYLEESLPRVDYDFWQPPKIG